MCASGVREIIVSTARPRLQISVEFTNHCNMTCRFCPHSIHRRESPSGNRFDRDKGFMSDRVFDLALGNAKKYGREVLVGFFGEQTMHKRFAAFTRLLSDCRCRKVLNTNWSYITAANMEFIKLYDLVRISIDASNADLYEQLCPGGAFLDLDGGLAQDRYAALVEKIEHWFDLPDHAKTWLVYVTSSINEHDRNEFVRQWLPKTPRRDSVVTKRVVSYGGIMADETMRKYQCRIPREGRVVVAWNGDCSPCNLDVNMALRSGNILDTPDLGVLVASAEWQKTLRRIEGRKGICVNCFDSNNHTKNVRHAGKRK